MGWRPGRCVWGEGGTGTPSRSKGGTRYYSKEDVERLKRIKQLKTIHRLNSAAIRRELESTGSSPLSQDGRKDDQPAAEGVGKRLRPAHATQDDHQGAGQNHRLVTVFLSALERGETGASIASLSSIVQVYGMNMRDVFDADLKKSSLLVRPEDRPTMQWSNGVRYEELAASSPSMNPPSSTSRPTRAAEVSTRTMGKSSCTSSGSFYVELEERETFRLEARDVLYFPSTTPHRWWTEDEEAEVIYVNSPPTF